MAKTILIVEDFDDIRDLMRILIEVHGFRVVEATGGREAVDRAREFTPDLILMDLAMPAFDGIQATRELKNDPELRDIPIVAITSHNHAFHDEALAAGCTRRQTCHTRGNGKAAGWVAAGLAFPFDVFDESRRGKTVNLLEEISRIGAKFYAAFHTPVSGPGSAPLFDPINRRK